MCNTSPNNLTASGVTHRRLPILPVTPSPGTPPVPRPWASQDPSRWYVARSQCFLCFPQSRSNTLLRTIVSNRITSLSSFNNSFGSGFLVRFVFQLVGGASIPGARRNAHHSPPANPTRRHRVVCNLKTSIVPMASFRVPLDRWPPAAHGPTLVRLVRIENDTLSPHFMPDALGHFSSSRLCALPSMIKGHMCRPDV